MEYTCLFLLCFFMFIGAAAADSPGEGWTAGAHSDGITVYIRPIPGSPMSEFMGVGDIDAPLEVVKEVFLDFSSCPLWYGMCKELKKIKQFNDVPYHYYLHDVIKSPWPVTD